MLFLRSLKHIMSKGENNGMERFRFQWHLYLPVLIVTGVMMFPFVRKCFTDGGLRGLYILLVSFFVSFSMTPVFGAIAKRFNVMDNPDFRKLHVTATPLLGGAAVFGALVIAVILNGIYTKSICAILMSATLLFIVGVFDDIKEISAGFKIVAQLLACLAVMYFGVVLRVIPDQFGALAFAGNIVLTLIWIIGITNAMNFFDGMDGLAAGLGVVISFFLGIIAFQTSQPFLGWISVAVMGSCMGFLPYNLKGKGRASIFLGDGGSTTIGFILACIAVYGEWAVDNPVVALVSPLLIFWVLIFDMVYITVDRIVSGKVVTIRQWLEYVDQDHLHHRLAKVIGSPKKSVFFIYMLSLCLGISAVVLRNAGPTEAYLLIVQAVILVVLITVLERYGRSGSPKG